MMQGSGKLGRKTWIEKIIMEDKEKRKIKRELRIKIRKRITGKWRSMKGEQMRRGKETKKEQGNEKKKGKNERRRGKG